MTSIWKQSERRVQIHEIGHGVVDFALSGLATDRAVYLVDGEFLGHTESQLGGKTFAAMNRDEQLAVVAGFYGGWAAVHLAIKRDLLEAAPPGIETCPGDMGFRGGNGSDEYWVDYFSALADRDDPIKFAQEARSLALATLDARMGTVLELAAAMDGMNILPAERLVSALS